jgi:hypothetical protein
MSWTRLVTSGDSATVTFTASSALNTSAHVIEVQGTYDVIGTGLSTINAGAASRTTNGLTPTNADNAVLAIAGIHGFTATGSGGSADNTFTLTEANFPATATASRSRSPASAVARLFRCLRWLWLRSAAKGRPTLCLAMHRAALQRPAQPRCR